MDKPALADAKILVVEDEPMIVLDLEQLLQSAGAVVRTASHVSDALTLIEREAFSAAVVDHGLRDQKSRAIYEHLENRNIPYVIYTGYDEITGRPGKSVIRKPADPTALLDAVKDLLAR